MTNRDKKTKKNRSVFIKYQQICTDRSGKIKLKSLNQEKTSDFAFYQN